MAQVLVFLYLCIFPLLVLLLLLRFATTRRRLDNNGLHSHHGRLPPSPPGKLPVIGHLHLISAHPHVALRDLADAHGADGLVLLRLGQVLTLAVSSPRAAEAVMRAHDHAFASRPPSAVADILFGGSSDVALAPYGEYWRQARKLVTTHLLSASKVRSLRRAREEEALAALARVREAARGGAAVDVGALVGAFVNDVVCRAVSGKFFRAEGRHRLFRELIDGNAELLGGFNLDDYFPSLAKAPVLSWILCARIRRLKKKWDELLDEIIDERAAKLSVQEDHGNKNNDGHSQEEGKDFIDVVLSLQQEYSLTREQVKAILVDMFAAGTDTSSIVLEYAMVELIRSPHLMTKLQAEITNNTPKGQEMVKEEDLNNMIYLKAVIKETLRLHPPVPLLLPRLSMDKYDVTGYTIPTGTRVMINSWALGRDPGSWEKANDFMPERFMGSVYNASVDFKGRDFKFVPFGAGRRICPGMSFGMATVEIMLANLVFCFDWELPAGTKTEDIDMTDVFGLTMHRKDKLKLVPRLLDHHSVSTMM